MVDVKNDVQMLRKKKNRGAVDTAVLHNELRLGGSQALRLIRILQIDSFCDVKPDKLLV